MKTKDLFTSPFTVGADSPHYIDFDVEGKSPNPNVFKIEDLFSEATNQATGTPNLAINRKPKPTGLELFAALHGSDYGKGNEERDLTFEEILNRGR
jgi:hypothetical protein